MSATKIGFTLQPLDEVLKQAELPETGSLVERVYQLLREKIINLSLSPEVPLPEKEIAAILNVSKTPVREALIRLANDRLVNIVPKSGSYVSAISVDRYLEACFIRVQLEGGCVRRLAEKGLSMAEEVHLRSLVSQQKQLLEDASGQYEDFFLADEAFHKTLFQYAGLPGAWTLLNGAQAEIDRVRHLKIRQGILRSRAVIEEHTKIIQAIVDRSPDSAEAVMVYHIGSVDDQMLSMSENPQFLQTIESFNLLLTAQSKGRSKIQ
ncbi:GntR family transcriptional regulator [Reinekea marinisedimentorum]|uniref:DNA-binding GntR family transcriptional regulator n=1 Tax=Reinekea marinisedimentorum TaxID=230495 RepID=A0A4R3IA55_9GAMM|nr:GntR family transcriptional regulator [Reinekea marinisedimentorum]TCS42367.1 DNA-binding GntR family transcriptional regulator [Reinekea marinisedimentorum]